MRFQELYQRCFARLVRELRRQVPSRAIAEDLAQETLLRAYVKLYLYDPNRPLWPWVRAISRRILADHAAALGREIPSVPRETETHDDLRSVEDRAVLSAALERLAPRHRAALGLRYVEDREAGEAATHLGVSLPAFNQLLFRARIRLREEYRRLTDGVPAAAALRAAWRRALRRAHRALAGTATSRVSDPLAKAAGVALGLALALAPVTPVGDAPAHAHPAPADAGPAGPLEAPRSRPAATEEVRQPRSPADAGEETSTAPGRAAPEEAPVGTLPPPQAGGSEDPSSGTPAEPPGESPLSGPAEAPETVTQADPDPVATDAEVRPIVPVPPILQGDPDPVDALPQVVCQPCP